MSFHKRIVTGIAAGLAFFSPLMFTGMSVHSQQSTSPSNYIIRYDTINRPVVGTGGMVASQNTVASLVGADILRKGGNAVDASVAVGFALAVTLPRAGNIGGGGFMLVHDSASNETRAIEFYGQAPAASDAAKLRGENGRLDPNKRYSHLGAAIPGTVAGLFHAHERFGKLPWRDVVMPAVQLARDGIIVTQDLATVLKGKQPKLSKDRATAQVFYKPDGTAYEAGETLRQEDLAWSLEAIANGGADAFYRGKVADKIVEDMERKGGWISAEDLDGYRARESAPIWGSYRGTRIAYMPPTSSGVILNQMMQIIETQPMAEFGTSSADGLHVIAEATKLVSADRRAFIGGYPHHRVAVDSLLDPDYIAARAAKIDMGHSLTRSEVPAGPLPERERSRDTTHYSVMDADGNAVSVTYTISSSFGTHTMVEGAGFLLNDSMSNFTVSIDPENPERHLTHPNRLAPGKRVISTITPILVFDGDKPWIATGSPGGARIITSVAQLLVNIIDHKMNIAEATVQPRIFSRFPRDILEVEKGLSADTIRALEARGHNVTFGATMGSTQTVMTEDGLFFGAADPRRPDASAVAVNP